MAYQGRQPGVGVRNRFIYTAAGGQTTFSGADSNGKTLAYQDGAYVDVFLNGVCLVPATDFTATTKTSVTLTSGATASDVVEIVCYDIASMADTVSKSQGGTFNSPVEIQGSATTVLTVDRATSDGTLLDFQKDGTTVGSIGSRSGLATNLILYPNSGNGSGITGAVNAIAPIDETGGVVDGELDLGGSSYRFKDLYLSGGVYLGGTGAANYLDDYEEGTWTPTATSGISGFSQVSSSYYIKVGNLVTVSFYLDSFTGKNASRVEIAGLPFTVKNGPYFTAIADMANATIPALVRAETNTTYLAFFKIDSSRSIFAGTALGAHIIMSHTYQTE